MSRPFGQGFSGGGGAAGTMDPNDGPDQPQVPNPSSVERTPQAPQSPEDAQIAKDFPDEIKAALIDLVKMGERESDFARRGHYRRMLEAEEFWKGNQYPIWSEKDFSFRTPFDWALDRQKLDDQPAYQYIINIYQATGLTVVAALSQKIPKVRFFPHSAKSEVDIATANASSDIAELIEKNNRLRMMAIREATLLWVQGGFGKHTRFVREKEKGIEQIPQVESSTVTVAPDRFNCPGCGEETPADQLPGTPTVDENGVEGAMRSCPGCSQPLTDDHFAASEQAQVPVVTGYQDVPEGYEKMSVYGFLNLKMMPYAQDFKGTGYLHLVEDIHESAIRAAYIDQQGDIGYNSDAGQTNTVTSSDTYERTGRMKLYDASSPYSSLRAIPSTNYITYKRCWLRRWYLLAHPSSDMRMKLYNLFPNGVYVALAGEKFLEARDEDIDECWTICSAMPGWGIYTEPIGGSTIPLQKQINDGANIVAEHLDFGTAPPIFTDAEFLNMEALGQQKMRPGNMVPVVRTRGAMSRNLNDLMYQPSIKIDTNIYGYGRSLIEMVQVVSGAMPSLFGGKLAGNDTAQAYAQSRDQALGKLELFWAAVKQHHADAMRQGVECFRKNRTQDAEKVVVGKSNDYMSNYIRLADLKGSIIAEPEADEDFPSTWADIRSNFAALMQSSPQVAQVFASLLTDEPANAPILKKFLANPMIVLPAEDNREKQFREIDELLLSPPIAVPDLDAGAAGQVDPTTGQPPVKYVSTVAPEVHGDDHVTHIKTIQEWVVDDEGMTAKKMNPEGYANVMAHLLDHKEAMAEVQAFEQALMAKYGIQPPEPEGGPPGSTKPGPQKPSGPPHP